MAGCNCLGSASAGCQIELARERQKESRCVRGCMQKSAARVAENLSPIVFHQNVIIRGFSGDARTYTTWLAVNWI